MLSITIYGDLNLKVSTVGMNKIINACILLISTLIANGLMAQSDSVQYQVEMKGIASTGTKSPFWIQNNQYGTVPFDPNSLTIFAKLQKEKSDSNRLFDYNFVSSAYINIASNTSAILHELYLNGRFWIFNASVGMREESYGNQDETLSGGGLLFSKNARPMPKIFVGIEDFTPLFFKNKLIEIKGGVSHGWFTDQIYTKDLLLHHKYATVRIGGTKSPVHVQYSLDHAAQWGGIVPGFSAQPTGIKDFINVFLARSGSSSSTLFEQINVGGNHIISQSTKIELSISDYTINSYWQNISEDKPIRIMWKAVNIADGLWGLSIENKKLPFFQKFLYEYLNTTDQTGPYHDIDGIIYGGNDNYYNNYLYQNGWTNYGRTIGSPFITSPVYNKNKEVYILNNRVQVHHIGMQGTFKGYNYKVIGSFTKNYGNYYFYPNEQLFTSTNILFDFNKHFKNFGGIDAGILVAADLGSMYSKNLGIMIKLSKKGNFIL
jgi:hypothetical protein